MKQSHISFLLWYVCHFMWFADHNNIGNSPQFITFASDLGTEYFESSFPMLSTQVHLEKVYYKKQVRGIPWLLSAVCTYFFFCEFLLSLPDEITIRLSCPEGWLNVDCNPAKKSSRDSLSRTDSLAVIAISIATYLIWTAYGTFFGWLSRICCLVWMAFTILFGRDRNPKF